MRVIIACAAGCSGGSASGWFAGYSERAYEEKCVLTLVVTTSIIGLDEGNDSGGEKATARGQS